MVDFPGGALRVAGNETIMREDSDLESCNCPQESLDFGLSRPTSMVNVSLKENPEMAMWHLKDNVCADCSQHLQRVLLQMPGVLFVAFEDLCAVLEVAFDGFLLRVPQIEETLQELGYVAESLGHLKVQELLGIYTQWLTEDHLLRLLNERTKMTPGPFKRTFRRKKSMSAPDLSKVFTTYDVQTLQRQEESHDWVEPTADESFPSLHVLCSLLAERSAWGTYPKTDSLKGVLNFPNEIDTWKRPSKQKAYEQTSTQQQLSISCFSPLEKMRVLLLLENFRHLTPLDVTLTEGTRPRRRPLSVGEARRQSRVETSTLRRSLPAASYELVLARKVKRSSKIVDVVADHDGIMASSVLQNGDMRLAVDYRFIAPQALLQILSGQAAKVQLKVKSVSSSNPFWVLLTPLWQLESGPPSDSRKPPNVQRIDRMDTAIKDWTILDIACRGILRIYCSGENMLRCFRSVRASLSDDSWNHVDPSDDHMEEDLAMRTMSSELSDLPLVRHVTINVPESVASLEEPLIQWQSADSKSRQVARWDSRFTLDTFFVSKNLVPVLQTVFSDRWLLRGMLRSITPKLPPLLSVGSPPISCRQLYTPWAPFWNFLALVFCIAAIEEMAPSSLLQSYHSAFVKYANSTTFSPLTKRLVIGLTSPLIIHVLVFAFFLVSVCSLSLPIAFALHQDKTILSTLTLCFSAGRFLEYPASLIMIVAAVTITVNGAILGMKLLLGIGLIIKHGRSIGFQLICADPRGIAAVGNCPYAYIYEGLRSCIVFSWIGILLLSWSLSQVLQLEDNTETRLRLLKHRHDRIGQYGDGKLDSADMETSTSDIKTADVSASVHQKSLPEHWRDLASHEETLKSERGSVMAYLLSSPGSTGRSVRRIDHAGVKPLITILSGGDSAKQCEDRPNKANTAATAIRDFNLQDPSRSYGSESKSAAHDAPSSAEWVWGPDAGDLPHKLSDAEQVVVNCVDWVPSDSLGTGDVILICQGEYVPVTSIVLFSPEPTLVTSIVKFQPEGRLVSRDDMVEGGAMLLSKGPLLLLLHQSWLGVAGLTWQAHRAGIASRLGRSTIATKDRDMQTDPVPLCPLLMSAWERSRFQDCLWYLTSSVFEESTPENDVGGIRRPVVDQELSETRKLGTGLRVAFLVVCAAIPITILLSLFEATRAGLNPLGVALPARFFVWLLTVLSVGLMAFQLVVWPPARVLAFVIPAQSFSRYTASSGVIAARILEILAVSARLRHKIILEPGSFCTGGYNVRDVLLNCKAFATMTCKLFPQQSEDLVEMEKKSVQEEEEPSLPSPISDASVSLPIRRCATTTDFTMEKRSKLIIQDLSLDLEESDHEEDDKLGGQHEEFLRDRKRFKTAGPVQKSMLETLRQSLDEEDEEDEECSSDSDTPLDEADEQKHSVMCSGVSFLPPLSHSWEPKSLRDASHISSRRDSWRLGSLPALLKADGSHSNGKFAAVKPSIQLKATSSFWWLFGSTLVKKSLPSYLAYLQGPLLKHIAAMVELHYLNPLGPSSVAASQDLDLSILEIRLTPEDLLPSLTATHDASTSQTTDVFGTRGLSASTLSRKVTNQDYDAFTEHPLTQREEVAPLEEAAVARCRCRMGHGGGDLVDLRSLKTLKFVDMAQPEYEGRCVLTSDVAKNLEDPNGFNVWMRDLFNQEGRVLGLFNKEAFVGAVGFSQVDFPGVTQEAAALQQDGMRIWVVSSANFMPSQLIGNRFGQAHVKVMCLASAVDKGNLVVRLREEYADESSVVVSGSVLDAPALAAADLSIFLFNDSQCGADSMVWSRADMIVVHPEATMQLPGIFHQLRLESATAIVNLRIATTSSIAACVFLVTGWSLGSAVAFVCAVVVPLIMTSCYFSRSFCFSKVPQS